MQFMGELIFLKNGSSVRIIESLTDYLFGRIFYLLESESGKRFVISKQDLEGLLPKTKFSKEEKYQLFLDYFQGRKDLYAKRWISKDRKGYAPHCSNEWSEVCPKKTLNNPKFNCSKCHKRSFYPYDKNVVERHILGNQREFFGIYPMIDGDKTHFIVLDFDKENALKEAQTLVKSAQNYQIKFLIEQSQSGEGIHLWLFFQEAIPAYLARKLGNLILLDASNHSVHNFMSFDRMIPMQDLLPKDSFGNLIALPLKWENVQEEKSTFLNSEFNLIPSFQLWQHLASIPRYREDEIHQFIEKLEIANPIQDYQSRNTKNEKVKYPKEIQLKKSGELIISKDKLTRKEQISLMYLATFKNPEYYKRQKMRTTTWDIPRLITSAREDSEFIYLPRALEGTLKSKIKKVKIFNQQVLGEKIVLDFTGKLYPEQEVAFQATISKNIGILSARTGFGKTIVSAKIIAERKVSTLVLVQNQNLAEQWQKQLEQVLNIQSEAFVEYTATGRVKKKPRIGMISGNKTQQTKIVDVAMIQKLARLTKEDLQELLADYGQVIVDECHHIAAQTFEQVIRHANSQYIVGLSATPEREDGLTPIISMRCGEVIFESEKFSQDNLLLKNYLYPRYTSIGELDKDFEKFVYPEQLNFLSHSQSRNQQITDDIVENYHLGRVSQILSERVEHLNLLSDLLEENVLHFTLTGRQSKKENREIIERLKFEKAPFVLFATSKLAGEGFDLPQLDTLFLTSPFKAKGSHQQYLGRLQRDLKNKDELRVYDYVDISSGLFAAMYQKRLNVYKRLNYELAEDEATRKYQARIFTDSDYENYFKEDLRKAQSEIQVIVPVLSKILCETLIDLSQKGVAISVDMLSTEHLQSHLKAHQENQIENLKQSEIAFKLSSNISQSIAIIDNQKCWYGDINFLSQSNKESSSIRFDNEKLVEELKGHYGKL